MAKSFKLSSIGGIAVAGAALGLYLGSSAISEINPAYYSTPSSASSFHADLVPNPADRDGARPLPELAEVVSDLGATCVSCSLSPDDHAAVNYPSIDSYGPPRPLPADLVLAQADEYVSRGLSPREVGDIERYAHFRVSDDEGRPEVAASLAAEPSSDGAAAGQREDEEEAAPGI